MHTAKVLPEAPLYAWFLQSGRREFLEKCRKIGSYLLSKAGPVLLYLRSKIRTCLMFQLIRPDLSFKGPFKFLSKQPIFETLWYSPDIGKLSKVLEDYSSA